MGYPENYRYTKEHEWVQLNDGVATVGITAFATEELGDIVFVELPEVGATVSAGDSFCVVESTKAASDVYAPISGRVIAVNDALPDDPEKLNKAPYTDAWLARFEDVDVSEIESLMDALEYEEFVGSK